MPISFKDEHHQIISDMSNEEYHGHDTHLSASGAKIICEHDLAHFKHQDNKTTDAMIEGTLTHGLLFEPNKIGREFEQHNFARRAGKEWNEFLEKAGNKTLVHESLWEKCQNMVDRVRDNEHAVSLLKSGEAEVSVFAKDIEFGVLTRCRPDWWNKKTKVMLDLKTTAGKVDADTFAKEVAKFGYHIQESFYRRVMAMHGIGISRFVFCVVSKQPPHGVAIYELDDLTRREGDVAVEYALREFRRAQESGVYPFAQRELSRIRIPSYAFKFTKPEMAIGN